MPGILSFKAVDATREIPALRRGAGPFATAGMTVR